MKALLHSVSYAGLWGQAALSLDAFIDKAAELGFNGVMLMAKRPHLSLLDYGGPTKQAALRARLERHGFTGNAVVLAGYNNFTADMEHGEVPQRELQIGHIVELARLTAALGGSVVRVFTGYENPTAGYSTQWRLVMECLRECSRRAADFGVTIGVQNHHDIAAGWESMQDLIREVNEPNCRALFDAWAPALHGADIAAAAHAMAAVTVHTTIADYQLRPRYRYQPAIVNYTEEKPAVLAVPMGEGFIDYRSFLSALRQGGFEGTVAYEMCSPLRDGHNLNTLDTYALRFLDWAKRYQ